jgi:hypothetical protein
MDPGQNGPRFSIFSSQLDVTNIAGSMKLASREDRDSLWREATIIGHNLAVIVLLSRGRRFLHHLKLASAIALDDLVQVV